MPFPRLEVPNVADPEPDEKLVPIPFLPSLDMSL
jgi:hypothetical protein